MLRTLFVVVALGVAPSAFGAGSIAAAPDAACAVLDGEVVCWGQVGSLFGRATSADSPSDTPTRIPGLRGVVSLDVTAGHACAVRKDGRVVCFGTNRSGELGSGNYRRGGRRVVQGLSGAKDVAVGGSTESRGGHGFACAIAQDDSVFCWGSNRRGQLGHSGMDRSSVRLHVPVGDAVAVEAGEDFACALGREGAVRCWGGGDYKARVIATGVSSMDVNGDRLCVVDDAVRCGEHDGKLAALKLPKGAVSAGVDHVCVQASGRVSCAGNNWGGALGFFNDTATTEIYTGFQFTCARAGDEVTCWGNNYTGVLGTPPEHDEPRARPPQKVTLDPEKRG
jgi:alpha-tubulin suppressor-like RCC1 family protein